MKVHVFAIVSSRVTVLVVVCVSLCVLLGSARPCVVSSVAVRW